MELTFKAAWLEKLVKPVPTTRNCQMLRDYMKKDNL